MKKSEIEEIVSSIIDGKENFEQIMRALKDKEATKEGWSSLLLRRIMSCWEVSGHAFISKHIAFSDLDISDIDIFISEKIMSDLSSSPFSLQLSSISSFALFSTQEEKFHLFEGKEYLALTPMVFVSMIWWLEDKMEQGEKDRKEKTEKNSMLAFYNSENTLWYICDLGDHPFIKARSWQPEFRGAKLLKATLVTKVERNYIGQHILGIDAGGRVIKKDMGDRLLHEDPLSLDLRQVLAGTEPETEDLTLSMMFKLLPATMKRYRDTEKIMVMGPEVVF
jgi:hypothetical protein